MLMVMVLDAGLSKDVPTQPAVAWADLTCTTLGCAAYEAALMTQFSQVSDHLQPPLKVLLHRSAG